MGPDDIVEGKGSKDGQEALRIDLFSLPFKGGTAWPLEIPSWVPVGIQRISEVLLTLGINKFLQMYHLQMIIRISGLPVSYIAVIIIIQGLGDFWQTALLDQKANVPSLGPHMHCSI